jgi:hypothetical protein
MEDGDPQLHAQVVAAFRALQAAEAQLLRLVYRLDITPGSVPGARPGTEAATFLRHALRVAHPGAVVRAARALAEDLPQLEGALAAGEVSRAHVDVAVRTLNKIPRHLLDGEGMAKVDAWFTETSLDLAPPQADVAARHLLQVLDPDGGDTFDPESLQRRELTTAVDSTGMVVIRGQLDPANGAFLRAALDVFSKPDPVDHDAVLPIVDTRSRRQREADALGLMAKLALGTLTTKSEVDRPHVVIHAPIEGPVADCDQTGPIPRPWVARFLCDAVVEAVLIGRDGQVLNLGQAVRTVTPVQRRALIARDRTCVIPGCTTPAAWCEAHHVRWYSKGGATDLCNLAMVCGRHHDAIHAGIWTLEMIDGVPWARPPTWIDPEQRPIRNTYQDHRRAAEQLALDLDPDTG